MLTDKHPQMRDSQMPIADRIDAAINRILRGDCKMRLPVEATDPDVVLSDCKQEIGRLKAESDEISKQWTLYHEENLLLKAALRWCLANSAGRCGNHVLAMNTAARYQLKAPPGFAPLIAEAVKS